MNVAGGIRIDEPGADLAVALAVASAAKGVPLQGSPRACFGEVGLTGELRTVAHVERRLEEATKFGLRDVVSPERAPTLREAVRMALARARVRSPLLAGAQRGSVRLGAARGLNSSSRADQGERGAGRDRSDRRAQVSTRSAPTTQRWSWRSARTCHLDELQPDG